MWKMLKYCDVAGNLRGERKWVQALRVEVDTHG